MINTRSIAWVMSLSASVGVMAAPVSQQSLLMTDKAKMKPLQKLSAPLKGKETSYSRLSELLKSRDFKATFMRRLEHPNLTYTAKSVFTIAGIPMKWGGIGFSGGVSNRYPVQPVGNAWPGGASVVLPFGDSDKYLGGAVAAGWANQGTNGLASSGFSKNYGAMTLLFSRWLGANTIVSGGVLSLASWGASQHVPKSYTGVVTQLFGPKIFGNYHAVSASIGCGTGALAPIGSSASFNDSTIYPFVNGAFNFTPNIAVAGDYYAETFAVGLSFNTFLTSPIPLPLSFMVFAGNLRHTTTAPSTTYGLRVSTGFDLPMINRLN